MAIKGLFRKIVSGTFALFAFALAALSTEAIVTFGRTRGWDKFLIDGWKVITDVGLNEAVVFGFFTLGGATVALWAEYKMREQREAKANIERVAIACTASFSFSETLDGGVSVTLDSDSKNVAHWAWYLNNGGTMRNHSFLFLSTSKSLFYYPRFLRIHHRLISNGRISTHLNALCLSNFKGYLLERLSCRQSTRAPSVSIDKWS